MPQLLLPMAWDQPDNADRVRRPGVGDWLPPRRRGAGSLTEPLARLMTDGVKARCRLLADRCAAVEGWEVAAGSVGGLKTAGPA